MTVLMYKREELFKTYLKSEFAGSYIADNFGKYAHPNELSRFLVRYELFKKIKRVRGTVIECGVLTGTGLFQFWHLARLLDPPNFQRWVFGFDTFTGFPSTHEKDGPHPEPGNLRGTSLQELSAVYKMHCSQPDAPAVKPVMDIVEGDFLKTADKFIETHSHLIVALLYLDFDLYEPTKKALDVFLPRMAKGSIIAFDDLNNHQYPGEAVALLESDLRDFNLRIIPFNGQVTYAVLE